MEFYSINLHYLALSIINNLTSVYRILDGKKKMDTSESVDVLTRLGLTSNEAKVFLVMSKLGKQPVKTLSQNSGVARESVYKVVKRLKEKGLVEEILTSPKTFRAIPEKDAYALLFQRREQEKKYLWTKMQQILKRKQQSKNGHIAKEEDEIAVLFPRERPPPSDNESVG